MNWYKKSMSINNLRDGALKTAAMKPPISAKEYEKRLQAIGWEQINADAPFAMYASPDGKFRTIFSPHIWDKLWRNQKLDIKKMCPDLSFLFEETFVIPENYNQLTCQIEEPIIEAFNLSRLLKIAFPEHKITADEYMERLKAIGWIQKSGRPHPQFESPPPGRLNKKGEYQTFHTGFSYNNWDQNWLEQRKDLRKMDRDLTFVFDSNPFEIPEHYNKITCRIEPPGFVDPHMTEEQKEELRKKQEEERARMEKVQQVDFYRIGDFQQQEREIFILCPDTIWRSVREIFDINWMTREVWFIDEAEPNQDQEGANGAENDAEEENLISFIFPEKIRVKNL